MKYLEKIPDFNFRQNIENSSYSEYKRVFICLIMPNRNTNNTQLKNVEERKLFSREKFKIIEKHLDNQGEIEKVLPTLGIIVVYCSVFKIMSLLELDFILCIENAK